MVELSISSVVLLILMGTILTVVRVTHLLQNSTQQGLDLQQNVRAALNILCRELINAGSGIPYVTKNNGISPMDVPSGAKVGPLGASISGTTVYFITACNSTGESVTKDAEGNALASSIRTDMLAFLGGMGDSRFVNQNAPGPVDGYGTTVYLEDNTIFGTGQVVIITNGFRVALGQITAVNSNGSLSFTQGQDSLALNAPADASNPNANYFAAQQIPGGPPPLVYPLSSITYYIDATTNPTHPSIKRLANSSAGSSAGMIVADDIENLQVKFLVDDDANMTTACVELDSPSLTQMPLVRGATIVVTGRSRVKMGATAYPDGHNRLSMSQTVFFRNNIRR